jgi:hypothetical protein
MPGRTVNSAADASGGCAGAGMSASSMIVTQQRPSPLLPNVTSGMTSFAAAPGLNGRMPIAIGPEPGTPT